MSENRNKPTSEALMQRVVDGQLQGVMETVNASFEALVTKQERVKLPEEVFRHHFLPFFTGQEVQDKSRKPVTEWIGIAGSPTASVDVVNEGGETMFTVPPMMDSAIVNLGLQKGKNLHELVLEYKLHGESVPGAAQKFYRHNVQNKLNSLVPGHTDESQAEKAWRKIFEHYDIKPPGQESTVEEVKKDNQPEDLDYE